MVLSLAILSKTAETPTATNTAFAPHRILPPKKFLNLVLPWVSPVVLSPLLLKPVQTRDGIQPGTENQACIGNRTSQWDEISVTSVDWNWNSNGNSTDQVPPNKQAVPVSSAVPYITSLGPDDPPGAKEAKSWRQAQGQAFPIPTLHNARSTTTSNGGSNNKYNYSSTIITTTAIFNSLWHAQYVCTQSLSEKQHDPAATSFPLMHTSRSDV
ncbi:hypothetical protein Ct61P_07696 [Colletotrichum tofieldiae]|nr:hypothetical protein Ct61P_07696 [Colletotrichum tofieldiae]